MVLRNVAKTFSLEEQRQEINEIAVDLDAVNTTLTNWNATNWDTAYGWGDHAQAGYLTSYTETDPVFGASAAGSITSTQVTNWDTAYGWGNHASAGYLTAESDTLATVTGRGSTTTTSLNSTASTNCFLANGSLEASGVNFRSRDNSGAGVSSKYHFYADDANAGNQILLRTDGSASFSGTITHDFNTNFQKGIRMLDNGGHSMLDVNGTGADATAIAVYDGTGGGAYKVKIKHDGSAEFDAPVRSNEGYTVYPPSDSNYAFATRNAANDTWTAFITAAGNATFEGNISVTGTVDGRDIATDGATLDSLSPGGTFSGAGTNADPAIGSIQFKNTGNTFGGDSLFTYDNTNNRLSVGVSSGSAALNVVRPGATSVDTAYLYASDSGADNRIRINTVANQGGHPYIKFDSGGSNMIVGQYWQGTTNNQLVLGVGEDPTGVTGISIDGNGNVTANNLALNQTNGSGATSTVLDHYEEGTWTPTPLGLSNSPTYSNLKGRYVRIGSLVQINGFIQMASSPTWNNVNDFFMLGPLPFNYNADNAGYYATAGSVTCQNFNFHDNDYSNTGQVNCAIANSSGTSYICFVVSDNNNTRGTVKNSAVSGNDIIEFSLTYRAG